MNELYDLVRYVDEGGDIEDWLTHLRREVLVPVVVLCHCLDARKGSGVVPAAALGKGLVDELLSVAALFEKLLDGFLYGNVEGGKKVAFLDAVLDDVLRAPCGLDVRMVSVVVKDVVCKDVDPLLEA